jgi:hypothetical protein
MKRLLATVVIAGSLAAAGLLAWKLEQVGSLLARLGGQQAVKTEASSSGDAIVLRTPGGLLEVARIKAYERFTRSDSLSWGPIDLGTTVSEIEVAALYRYQIEMARQWPLRCDAQACVVRAGEPLPALPAGIYTDEVRKRSQSGWARFNKDENLAQLERSVAAELGSRAHSARNIEAARTAGRKTVQEFVRTWMLKDPALQPAARRRIVVLFPGETPESRAGDL